MRVVGIVIALLVAAAAGAGGYAWWQHAHADDGDGPLALYGNIEIRDAQLAFNGEEHIAEVLVEEGDHVAVGQVLARLRTDRLAAQIERAEADIDAQREALRRLENGTRPQEIAQARANVTAAEARVENAQRIVDRLRDTAESGASSKQELDDARARLHVEQADLNVRKEALDLALEGPREEDIARARAQLAARQADLALLHDRLADATLAAPAAGIIQSRILEPGEYATPQRPVFTLALQSPKWARVYVPEPDLGKLRQGMPATVSSDSFPGKPLSGWVGFISPTAEFTPKTVQTEDLRTRLVYEVRVYVKDPDDQLRLGQPVTVQVDRGASRTEPDPEHSAAAASGTAASAPAGR